MVILPVVLAAACGGPPAVSPSAVGSPTTAASVPATTTPSPADQTGSPVVASPSGPPPAASPTTVASPTPAPTATPAPTPEPTAAPPVDAFPQTWSGTWSDPITGGAGSLELVLTGKGADFGGTITLDGTACLAAGILDGRFDDAEIAFTVTQRDVEFAFVGEASDAEMQGSFTSNCEAMDGTWAVQRGSR